MKVRPKSSKIPKDIETTPTKSFVYPISSISFSPVAPHDFAAAHSTTISIFSGQTLDRRSTISDFSDTITSTSFCCDRKLLAAGDLTDTVYVFDARSRDHLWRLKGHPATARLVRYPHAADKTHLFSGGDDSVVSQS
ncbi:transducin family protein / WD-40 repeat family protein [Striga asiatica]|uniref:Transducin family protein / WD-40 repeat family protein n=1 Tax=Striga asiatica TaxID=4170 RepID=A0A5A7RA03_STRAF|nr:transducin family protein / WD-40 repeat family protein [Striga asiatica]